MPVEKDNHIYLECSNCNAFLLDLLMNHPDQEKLVMVKANCPFCGDSTFTHEVKGGFCPGGYGTPKEDDPTDDIPSTIIETFVVDNNTHNFVIRKANKNAKPVYKR